MQPPKKRGLYHLSHKELEEFHEIWKICRFKILFDPAQVHGKL